MTYLQIKPYKVPRIYAGSSPSVTISKGAKTMLLSSGLVDKALICAKDCFEAHLDKKKHILKLLLKGNSLFTGEYVMASKSGGITKDQNDRLQIRMPEVWHEAGINPNNKVTLFAGEVTILNDGQIITINYGRLLLGGSE